MATIGIWTHFYLLHQVTRALYTGAIAFMETAGSLQLLSKWLCSIRACL